MLLIAGLHLKDFSAGFAAPEMPFPNHPSVSQKRCELSFSHRSMHHALCSLLACITFSAMPACRNALRRAGMISPPLMFTRAEPNMVLNTFIETDRGCRNGCVPSRLAFHFNSINEGACHLTIRTGRIARAHRRLNDDSQGHKG